MGMILSCIYLQLFQLSTAELVFREHAPDGLDDEIGRVFFQKLLGGGFFYSPHVTGVTIVFLVVHFVTGELNLLSIGNDYKITIVDKRGKSRLMFTS